MRQNRIIWSTIARRSSRGFCLSGILAIVWLVLAPDCLAWQGITGINNYYVTVTNNPTGNNYSTNTAANSGGGFPAGTNYAISFNYGSNNNMVLAGFSINTNYYQYIQLANQIVLNRVNNPSVTGNLEIIWYEENNATGTVTGTNIYFKPSYVGTMEQALLSTNINRGTDNIFCNTGDNNGDNNNIERVDYIFADGYPVHDNLGLRGFLVMDRGGNDPFQIAVITNLTSGVASAWSPCVSKAGTTNGWGNSGTTLNTAALLGYSSATNHAQQPSSQPGPQPLGGIFFTWQDFGVQTNQMIYGYTLVGGDVTNNTALWTGITNSTYFPTNTSEANGGLDLVGGGSIFFNSTLNCGVGDFVWDDYNGNGIQDSGEPGLSNVMVRIYDSQTNLAGLARTAADGSYLVKGLAPGTYFAKFFITNSYPQYIPSPANVGTNDAIDSDADTNTGQTATFTLSAGQTNLTIDAGAHQPPTDLTVTKTASTNRPNIGASVAYTITVTNKGAYVAGLVQLTDLLSAGLTFSSATPSSGTYNSTNGLWDIGSITNGGPQVTLTINATVNTNMFGQSITNTASITRMNRPDTNTADNTASAVMTVQTIDLGVTKSVNNSQPPQGGSITYTVVLTNHGPDAATSVIVTDVLPTGVTFSNATPSQGTYTNTTGLWTVGTVLNGGSATLQITATVNTNTSGSYITNTVTVTSADQVDTNTVNNTASATILVQSADLGVTKTVDNPTPNPSNTVTYTIAITNLGPTAATGVIVKDMLTNGLSFSGYSTSQGTYTNSNGIWAVGAIGLSNGATLSITATVTVTTIGAVLTNTATITAADQPDPNTNNNASTATVTVSGLNVTKSSSVVGSVTPGSNITYTIVISNASASVYSGITVTDAIPSGVSYVANSATNVGPLVTNDTVLDNFTNITFSENDGTKSWLNSWQELGEANGATNGYVLVTNMWSAYQLEIQRTGYGAWRSANIAGYTNAILSFNYRRNLGAGQTNFVRISTNSQPWVTIMTFTGLVSDAATQTTNYNINGYISTNTAIMFTNFNAGVANSNVAFDNVQIQFTKTAIFTNSGGAPPTLATNYTLAAGQVMTITYQVTVTNPATQTMITNTVSVTATGQTTPVIATRMDPVTTTDLGVTKTASNNNPNEGSNVVYTIVLTNYGPANASGVVLTDLLPSGLTYVSSAPSQGTYTNGNGIWAVGSIIAGGSANLAITASVNTGAAGSSITNTCSIIALNQVNTNSANNHASAVVVVYGVDLGVTKTVDQTTPYVAANFTYTIVVTNNGPNNATGIAIADLLTNALTYVSSTTTTGTYSNVTGIWSNFNLSASNSATLTITAQAPTNLVGKVITNIASVSHVDQLDRNSSNDSSTQTITPLSSPLIITKKSDYSTAGNPVPPGSNITYTIVVSNSSAIAQTNVTVTDLIPTGLTYVAGSSQITGPMQITDTFLDQFNNRVYSENDGTTNWTGSWVDSEDANPTLGALEVLRDNVRPSTYTFNFSGDGTANLSLARLANLGGYTNAVLSFIYRRQNLATASWVAVQVSSNGTNGVWTELTRFTGQATDAAYSSTNFTITPYISDKYSHPARVNQHLDDGHRLCVV